MKHYSPSTNGFYDKDVHGESIPGDAIEISDEQWQALLDAQSTGLRIVAGTNKQPIAVTYVPTAEERATVLLRRRNQGLQETDALVARHRDELELGGDTTLTPEQYILLLKWRAELRRLPQHPDFPQVELPQRPV
jgi:hypothetical protein